MLTHDFPRVDQARLDQLAARLADTVLPSLTEGSATAPGPSADLAERLLACWRDGFDFRAVEDRVAALGAVTLTRADGRRTVAIHSQPDDPTGVPILLVHGWPDSPLRFLDLIPHLVAAGHPVVAPALPGFWFSDQPEAPMSRELAATDLHELMSELGYPRYAVHGGDWGSPVAQSLAQSRPDSVLALHLTDVPFDLTFTIQPDDPTTPEAERQYLAGVQAFADSALYLSANTTAPNLIATALQDSPVGLVTWIGALYQDWQDDPIADEHIVANAALLYLTGTVRSSIRLYSEPAADWDEAGWDAATDPSTEAAADTEPWGDDDAPEEGWGEANSWAPEPVTTPTAFALFPADIAVAPRSLADRFFAVERFTVFPQGGHFAALEAPAALADDLLSFLAGRR